MLRWRGQINVYESLYIFPASLGVGLLNSSQFTGLAASIEKPDLAMAVGVFYLSQQIGLMIGAGGSSALLRRAFSDILVADLGDVQGRDKVSSAILLSMPFPTDLEPEMLDLSVSAANDLMLFMQIIKAIVNDARYASHLTQGLQVIVLSAYAKAFCLVSSKICALAPRCV